VYHKLFPVQCPYSNSDFVDQLIVVTLAPILVSVIWFATYFVMRQILHHLKVQEDIILSLRAMFVFVFLIFVYFVLPGVSVVIAQSFPCTNLDPDQATGSLMTYLRY
jgi:hypothetical protein